MAGRIGGRVKGGMLEPLETLNLPEGKEVTVTIHDVPSVRDVDASFARQVGSHQRYRHPDGRRVTVSFHHARDTFPLKTLKSMIEDQARWTEADLRRLGLLT